MSISIFFFFGVIGLKDLTNEQPIIIIDESVESHEGQEIEEFGDSDWSD